METKVISNEELESRLKQTKKELHKTSAEKEALKKAIWDMLNYAQMFILLLDSKMNILLINYSFAVKLGFKNEKEPIGRCWLDFIKPKEHDQISAIHHSLVHDSEKENHKYREVVSDIVKLNGKVCTIKWFNFAVNHEYNLTFSFGIPKEFPTEITEHSIRSYYQDVLQKDKTMILSLRDTVLGGIKASDKCDPELGGF